MTEKHIGHEEIEALLAENRHFPPPAEFAAQARVNSPEIYAEAAADLEGFWAKEAGKLDWFEPWDTVLDWQAPYAKWFDGGKINVSYNCLDRHVIAGKGDRVAYYWEGEPGDYRVITYQELLDDVSRCANALKALGIRPRRSGRHLHADDPRARRRNARLHPNRRAAHRGVRRLLVHRAFRSDQRCAGQSGHHRGRRIPTRSAHRD